MRKSTITLWLIILLGTIGIIPTVFSSELKTESKSKISGEDSKKKKKNKSKKNKSKKEKSKKSKSNKAKAPKKSNFLFDPYHKMTFTDEQRKKIEDLRSYKKLKSIEAQVNSSDDPKAFKKSVEGKKISQNYKRFKKFVGSDLRAILTDKQLEELDGNSEEADIDPLADKKFRGKLNVKIVRTPNQSQIDQYVIEKLTDKGKKLHSEYSQQLKELREEIKKQLPAIDRSKKDAYVKAHQDLLKAEVIMLHKKAILQKRTKAVYGRKAQRQGWVTKSTLKVKATKDLLEAAKLEGSEKAELVKKLEDDLFWEEKNLENGKNALKRVDADLEQAKRDEPRLKKEANDAEDVFLKAKDNVKNLIKGFNVKSLISSDKLDKTLVKFMVLKEADPIGLAFFAQESAENKKLIEDLLKNDELMKQIVVADGVVNDLSKKESWNPFATKYGQAMRIYADIQKASKKASEGLFQRLALAISLEHAKPVMSSSGGKDKPDYIDPVKRYLHYVKAYQDGELDPAFKDFTVWEYRMVIDGPEHIEEAAWGRQMLRNYNPTLLSAGSKWNYVKLVTSDVAYNSKDKQYDNPELFQFQNILNNGGVCGRRAFMGRFILRCFGIPTKARPQTGHAALIRWTSKGWVPVLGGGWGSGHTAGYSSDKDFLAVTQAREDSKSFLQVQRAQWIGDFMYEHRQKGLLDGTPDVWNGVALYRQDDLIKELKAVALEAVGAELGESDSTVVKGAKEVTVTVTKKDKKIIVKNGTLTIPAAAATSTNEIKLMKSNRGGLQLHLQRSGKEVITYTFDAPKAGTYELIADVVTVHWKQKLLVNANNSETSVEMAFPYTIGEWKKSKPVKVKLVKGSNVLTFSRTGENIKGITIRDFTLKPVN